MSSLRRKLLVTIGFGVASILGACGIVLSVLVQRTLRQDFEASLESKARWLAEMVEHTDAGLEFEGDELALPDFLFGESEAFFQIWKADGESFRRSPSLGAADLPRREPTSARATFDDAVLPPGTRVRVVWLQFAPRIDPDNPPRDPTTPMRLACARSLHSMEKTLMRIDALLLSVGALAVALAMIVLHVAVGRGMRPIAELSGRIAEVRAHDLTRPIEFARVPTEIRPVAQRLNELLVRLDEAFQRERRFTGDVAHELRTPLAGLRATLELALSRVRSAENYRESLADATRITLSMQRVVEALLHLAREDAGQNQIVRTTVSLADLIQDCWQAFEASAAARNISVDWDVRATPAVSSDSDRLRLLINNLLDNAVSHANECGQIRIMLAPSDRGVVFKIENTCSPQACPDVTRAFERFWRGDPTFAPGSQHHGLGLPLAKAIIERLNGTIAAHQDSREHFEIRVWLPTAS